MLVIYIYKTLIIILLANPWLKFPSQLITDRFPSHNLTKLKILHLETNVTFNLLKVLMNKIIYYHPQMLDNKIAS